jgi:phytoene dehydrogenase-like protein
VAITSRDGAVTGVALASGDEIAAPAVVSGLDPKRTLTTLCDPVAVGPTTLWRAGNLRTPGVVSKVNLVLDGLPRFSAAAGEDEQLLRGRILVAPGIDAIERAHDASKYGRIADSLVMEATIPSLVDPALVADAAAGSHVMSVIVQYTPYGLRDGSWDDAERREGVANAVVGAIDDLAPGFSSLVREREILTPLDLEREYGLTGGHPLHGEPGLDQFFLWRPLLGHARYRLVLEGLYLAGSGAHPGGGVTGQPGQNAAREILADMKGGRRRR